MRIYTKVGDEGETGLFGGGRVWKDDARVDAYGTIDELNSVIGWAAVPLDPSSRKLLQHIQSRLFDLGAELATAPGIHMDRTKLLTDLHVSELEAAIDSMDAKLPEMRYFILPTGTEGSARLHMARTVSRRAERAIVGFHKIQPVRPEILQFMNRLSDLLFVMARAANADANVDDVPWRPSKSAER